MAKEPRIIRPVTKEEADRLADEHALAVGRVAHSWNYLQETLATIFARLLQTEERFASAVWYSTDSDRSQRAMLRSLIDISTPAWPNYPKAADDIKWLLLEANSLADHRNTAIHAPVLLHIGGGEDGATIIGASPMSDHPRARRLVGKTNLADEFAWYEKWADVLTIFGRQMENALYSKTYAWPDRPQRPIREQKTSHADPGL